jgi:tRNA threonylcarbamoyladenosine biosynthesis protein TsaE
LQYKVDELSDLPAVSRKILESTDKKVFLFKGDLGAGKTTLIKAICAELGSVDVVSSPTFSLINEYKTREESSIFHFDFYRIKSPDEAMDMGFEEYLSSGQYCFIEWPEIIMKLIFVDYVDIEVKAEDNSRLIKVHV